MELVLLTCAQAMLITGRIFDSPYLSSAQVMELVEEIQEFTEPEPACELFTGRTVD